jgi:hypothetical protein
LPPRQLKGLLAAGQGFVIGRWQNIERANSPPRLQVLVSAFRAPAKVRKR